MKQKRKRVTVFILIVALLITAMDGFSKKAEAAVVSGNGQITLGNPIKGSQKYSPDYALYMSQELSYQYDCIYYGEYPQDEIVSTEIASMGTRDPKKIIISDNQYRILKNFNWGNRDCVTIRNVKYMRVSPKEGEEEESFYRYYKCQPIKWRVLHVKGKKAFLLADKVLDTYETKETEAVTWDGSLLRKWLNSGFTDTAFTEEEKANIEKTTLDNTNYDTATYTGTGAVANTDSGKATQDKVFLLSQSNVYEIFSQFPYYTKTNAYDGNSYGFQNAGGCYECYNASGRAETLYNYCNAAESLTGTCSAYAKAKGVKTLTRAENDYKNTCRWSLRTTRRKNTYNYFEEITESGRYAENKTNADVIPHKYGETYTYHIRPAMYLNLDNAAWAYAGTVKTAPGGDVVDESNANYPEKYLDTTTERLVLQLLDAAKNGLNPKIEYSPDMDIGHKVTYSCFWYGSYPQAEVITEAMGEDYESRGDKTIVSDKLYGRLRDADWSKDGTAVIDGKKYKRIKPGNATYKAQLQEKYQWKKDILYRYFQYEPIKWRVLDMDMSGDSDKVLLQADTILDCQYYNTEHKSVAWKDSSLYNWLNGYSAYVNNNFINTAFYGKEKTYIKTAKNKVTGIKESASLLTKRDIMRNGDLSGTFGVNSYGFSYDGYDKQYAHDEALNREVSDYALAMGAVTAENITTAAGTSIRAGSWLLQNELDSSSTPYITIDKGQSSLGAFPTSVYGSNQSGICPTITVNLLKAFDKGIVTYAGTVCTDGTVVEEAKPETNFSSLGLCNPIIENNGILYDCLYLGSYPQSEVITAGMGSYYGKSEQVIMDDVLYANLQNAAWSKNGDTKIAGKKYHRIAKEEVSYLADTLEEGNLWRKETTYRYFQYEKIKWRVLYVSEENGTVYLQPDLIINYQPYHDSSSTEKISWNYSTLRSWLNGYSNRYKDESNEAGIDYSNNNLLSGMDFHSDILYGLSSDMDDSICLLSDADIDEEAYGFYYDDNGDILYQAFDHANSAYAAAMGSAALAAFGNWLLMRDSSMAADRYSKALYYDSGEGRLKKTALNHAENGGICPVILLDSKDFLANNVIDYAGTVNTNGTIEEEGEETSEHTKEGFDLTTDGFCFINMQGSFNYPKGYQIPYARYKEIWKDYAADTYDQQSREGKIFWKGSCFGMCAAAYLFYKKQLSIPAAYQDEAAILGVYEGCYDYKENSYGYLSFLPDIKQEDIDYITLDGGYSELTKIIERYQIWQMERIEHEVSLTAAPEILGNTKEPYFLTVEWYNDAEVWEGGHALLVNSSKAIEDVSNDNTHEGRGWYRIYLYDPNKPGNENCYIDICCATDNTDWYGQWRLKASVNADEKERSLGYDTKGVMKKKSRAWFYSIDNLPVLDGVTDANGSFIYNQKNSTSLSCSCDNFTVADAAGTIVYKVKDGKLAFRDADRVSYQSICATDKDTGKITNHPLILEGTGYTVHTESKGVVIFEENGVYKGVDVTLPTTITSKTSHSLCISSEKQADVHLVMEDSDGREYVCIGTDVSVGPAVSTFSLNKWKFTADASIKQEISLHIESDAGEFSLAKINVETGSVIDMKNAILQAGENDKALTVPEENTAGNKEENNSEDTEKRDAKAGEGDSFTHKDAVYTITDREKKTVSFTKYIGAAKKVSIPASVTYEGNRYQVTGIGKKAFQGNKKIRAITVGRNITKIGNRAFSGCKRLSLLAIQSKKIVSIGKKACKGIGKDAVIQVPKAKKKFYRKLLKNSGSTHLIIR